MSAHFTLAALCLVVVGCRAPDVDRDHPKVALMLEEIERLREHAGDDPHLKEAAYYVTMAPSGVDVTFTGKESGDDARPDHSYEIQCSGDTIRSVRVATVVEVLLADTPSASRSRMKTYAWHDRRWIEGAELFELLYPGATEHATKQMKDGAFGWLFGDPDVIPPTRDPTTRP